MLEFSLSSDIPAQHQHAVYNALDCAITQTLKEELYEQINGTTTAWVVNYLNSIAAISYQMQMQGFRFDKRRAQVEIEKLAVQNHRIDAIFKQFTYAACGKEINSRSPKQLRELFEEHLMLPPFFTKEAKTHKQKETASREAIEFWKTFNEAAPIANCLLALRKNKKQLEKIDLDTPNGRYYFSFNPAGTDTWRFSSKKHDFYGGSNIQNVAPSLRHLFIADPGMKMAYVDLAQAEARLVGVICYILFGQSTYLDACEAGDLHTTVAMSVWPDLPWSATDPKFNKELAEQPYYLDYSRRDLAKRGGHGTNYGVKPRSMAKHLKITQQVAATFQDGYFARFPEIKYYHEWIAQQLQTVGYLDNLFGFRRIFNSRYSSTLQGEGIAFVPQSTIGVALNQALIQCSARVPNFYPIIQVHDAIVFQYPAEHEKQVIEDVIAQATLRYTLYSPEGKPREFILPCDAKTGWNWGYASEQNPNGLAAWKGEDKRTFNPRLFNLGISLHNA